jgi:hypothetical protein
MVDSPGHEGIAAYLLKESSRLGVLAASLSISSAISGYVFF